MDHELIERRKRGGEKERREERKKGSKQKNYFTNLCDSPLVSLVLILKIIKSYQYICFNLMHSSKED